LSPTQGEEYGAASMIANKCIVFQIALTNSETEATNRIIADMNSVVSQVERGIYGIILNGQMQFK